MIIRNFKEVISKVSTLKVLKNYSFLNGIEKFGNGKSSNEPINNVSRSFPSCIISLLVQWTEGKMN